MGKRNSFFGDPTFSCSIFGESKGGETGSKFYYNLPKLNYTGSLEQPLPLDQGGSRTGLGRVRERRSKQKVLSRA